MDDDATKRGLEARLATLEARLVRIEGQLGIRTSPSAPEADPAPSQNAPWPAAQPAAARPAPQSFWSAETRRDVAQTPAADRTSWGAASGGPRPSLAASLGDLEARLTGRALAWVGGIALILGAIFFLSLAFSRGWIGPEHRVLIGLIAGIVSIVAGAVFIERRNRLLGHVLTPVGLATISISLVGATRLYALVPVETGLAVAFASAAAAAVIAIRGNSPVVAAFGLVSVLISPPLLEAPADVSTLAFVGAVLVGTTVVSIWRGWSWLPALAFVLAAPQAAAWIDRRPDPAVALAGLGVFWAVNAIAAGGEEFRRRRGDLSASSATLLLANAAFLVWAGFMVLSGDLATWRGSFLLLGAAGHGVIGLAFVARDGDRNLFGLMTLGTGIALLTMAAPAQLGAPLVPIAWTAEATALTWLAVWRRHPYVASTAAVLYVLAAVDLILVHGRAADLADAGHLLDGETAALAFFSVGVAAGVGLVRDRSLRSVLAALGLLTVAWSLALRLEGLPIVVALTVLALVCVGVARFLMLLPEARTPWRTEGLIPISSADLDDLRPFLDQTPAGAIVIVGGVAAVGLVLDSTGAPAYAWAVVIAWTALASIAIWLVGVDRAGRSFFRLAGVTGLVAASVAALSAVAPPARLVVPASGVDPLVALQSGLGLATLVGGIAWLAASTPTQPWRRAVWLGAGLALVYLLSVVPVDIVATRVGSGFTLEEVRTQGQVALSVTWAVLGLIAFVAGLGRRLTAIRLAGLALLGLATAKVFAFDLAELEIAYRVISLIALGLLLLASAWVWQRLQPRTDPDPNQPPS